MKKNWCCTIYDKRGYNINNITMASKIAVNIQEEFVINSYILTILLFKSSNPQQIDIFDNLKTWIRFNLKSMKKLKTEMVNIFLHILFRCCIWLYNATMKQFYTN